MMIPIAEDAFALKQSQARAPAESFDTELEIERSARALVSLMAAKWRREGEGA